MSENMGTSIHMYCEKCNAQMTCLGIDRIHDNTIVIIYYCENCGITVKMNITLQEREI